MAYTAESVASYLKKMNKDYYGNKTWEQMFGNVSLSGQRAVEGLRQDYGTAIGEAYGAAQRTDAAIVGSNLISGLKSEAMLENELALQEAYDSYLKNYQSNLGTIAGDVAQGNASINETLMRQAQNYADYANAHIDYLYSLWDTYGASEGSMFNDPKFANYMKDIYNESGVVDGKELMGREELENLIFDANGYLTSAGKAFFEQMEYDELLKNDSFDMYLRNANPELREWAMRYNPYDYSPNVMGESTMAGTFREMTGRMSDDEVFDNMDRYLGMTAGTLNAELSKFEDTMSQLLDADLSNADNIDKIKSAFISMLDSTGLRDAFRSQINDEDIDDYINGIVEDYNTYKTEQQALLDKTKTGANASDRYKLLTEYKDDPETKWQPLKDLMIDLADYVKTEHDTYIKEFHDIEKSNGAEIMAYDATIAKSADGSSYDYALSDGSTITYLSSAKSSEVKSKTGRNFKVDYNGLSFKLEIGKGVMDAKTRQEIDSKVRLSTGKSLKEGDVFNHNGKLWIVSNDGQIHEVSQRFGKDDYRQLKELVNGEKTVDEIKNERDRYVSAGLSHF